jgi:hypothetical protein
MQRYLLKSSQSWGWLAKYMLGFREREISSPVKVAAQGPLVYLNSFICPASLARQKSRISYKKSPLPWCVSSCSRCAVGLTQWQPCLHHLSIHMPPLLSYPPKVCFLVSSAFHCPMPGIWGYWSP